MSETRLATSETSLIALLLSFGSTNTSTAPTNGAKVMSDKMGSDELGIM